MCVEGIVYSIATCTHVQCVHVQFREQPWMSFLRHHKLFYLKNFFETVSLPSMVPVGDTSWEESSSTGFRYMFHGCHFYFLASKD